MSLANAAFFSATTPAPSSGQQNIVWADDGGSPTVLISASDPLMEGDSGSGGLGGNVPAQAAGDAAAGKFLKADGTWAVPAGSSGPTYIEEEVAFSGVSGTLAHTPAAGTRLDIYRNGIRMTSLSGATPAIQKFSRITTAVTLATAAGGSDVFIATYSY